ncbi:hypothetical protein BDY17DRAFT_320926 [Neohortaea acidophila]|uniref:Agmatine deiminase n=1 Tax=Neohortaea acidophila TaxID=245834 RepID=A0A6A6Q290_9PEZI|nr:uncharacterized protein BDY17DRAFT_320926 [Neohortaea acidophila]KAF2486104.1 hypothetical protein BDY17DRAFT_320926 [Neohortaea acidophila]
MYTVPSEAKPHLRTLMAWPDMTSAPEEVGLTMEGDLHLARQEIAAIASAIARFEPVWLFARQPNVEGAMTYVSKAVTVKPLEVDQIWIRDSGPVFVADADGNLAGVDNRFNYWGDKFDVPGAADASVAKRILEAEGVPRVQAPLITEGGALEFDGEGTLLATESSIINPNRNPGKSRSQLEEGLRKTFGVSRFIWLEGAVGIDSTDCHVDALARLVPGDTVLLSRPNDAVSRDSIQYRLYQQARSVLEHATLASGNALKIVEMEEAEGTPRARVGRTGSGELPCLSYVNYYLPNGAVIVPAFGDSRTDARAIATIQQAWPEREVVPVKLNWMAYCGGGVHCATQQWPALPKRQ